MANPTTAFAPGTPQAAGAGANAKAARPRLPALDWMRGFVMVLMAIDHASGAFNGGRVFSDSARFYKPGTVLPLAQFLTRWITHLCAPTFVFLAGAAAALSVERRLRAGESARSVDRYLLQRGLLIALLDPLWMSWGFTGGSNVFLQVLYAIGTSLAAMTLMRRLPQAWLLGLALCWMFAGEAVTGALLQAFGGDPPLPLGLLVTGGRFGKLIVAYPTLPWLAIMMLGWAFGRWLVFGRAERPERVLALSGAAALSLFALVRGFNRYGNMLLARDDGSLVQWLHVSKYPPSLSYDALELGLMALALALLWKLGHARAVAPLLSFLLVLGQSALFFYLLHVHLLEGTALALGWREKFGVGSAYLGGIAIVFVLFPACLFYRGYKRAHPNGWTRYL
jgi:uncharacterized membrane protein